MHQYSVHFEIINNLRNTSEGWLVPNNYDFWKPLVLRYIKYSDTLRIDCWNNDEYAINRILPYAKKIDRESNPNMTSVWLDTHFDVIDDIINNPFDNEQKIAWFSLFLEKDENCFFSSEHYGKEFSVLEVNKEEVEFLRTFITTDFCFHIWDCSGISF